MTLTRDVATPHTLAEAALINNNFTNCGKELQPKSLVHNLRIGKKIYGSLLFGFESLDGFTATNCSLSLGSAYKTEGNYSFHLSNVNHSPSAHITNTTMALKPLAFYFNTASGLPSRGKLAIDVMFESGSGGPTDQHTITLKIGNDSSNYLRLTATLQRKDFYGHFATVVFDATSGSVIGTPDWTVNINYLDISITPEFYTTIYNIDNLITLDINTDDLYNSNGTIYYDGTAYSVSEAIHSSYLNKLIIATLSDGVGTLSFEEPTYRIQDETKVLLGFIDSYENIFLTQTQEVGTTLDLASQGYTLTKAEDNGSSGDYYEVIVCGKGYFVNAWAEAYRSVGTTSSSYPKAETEVKVYIDGTLIGEDNANWYSGDGVWREVSSTSMVNGGLYKFNYSLRILLKAYAYGGSDGGYCVSYAKKRAWYWIK